MEGKYFQFILNILTFMKRLLSFYTESCLSTTTLNGSNICCLSQNKNAYKLVKGYSKGSFKVHYYGKELSVNLLGSAADDCSFDFEHPSKGQKATIFIHLISEYQLLKLFFVVKSAIKNQLGEPEFEAFEKAIIYSRNNGISCFKWWGPNSKTPVYNITNSDDQTRFHQNPNDSKLLDKTGYINKGDLLKVHVIPQINIQYLQGGDKIYHIQFLVKGSIIRLNKPTETSPLPILVDDEDDPLAFLN